MLTLTRVRHIVNLQTMGKEVVLAIAIGFAVGIVITFGIWTANKSLKNLPTANNPTPTLTATSPNPTSSTSISPTPASSTTTNSSLTIETPEDELLTDKSTVTVSGKTVPGAQVVVLAEKNEYIVTADQAGKYTADVSLDGGYNTITVTSYDKTGTSSSQSITITLSTAKI